jgi:hypothetical protein
MDPATPVAPPVELAHMVIVASTLNIDDLIRHEPSFWEITSPGTDSRTDFRSVTFYVEEGKKRSISRPG